MEPYLYAISPGQRNRRRRKTINRETILLRIVREFDDLPAEEKSNPELIADYCQMFSRAGCSNDDQRLINQPDDEENDVEETLISPEGPTKNDQKCLFICLISYKPSNSEYNIF